MEKVVVFYTQNCVICMDHSSETIFGPCNHQCCCKPCSDTIRANNMCCPLCRSVISLTATEFQNNLSEPVDDGTLSIWIDCREAYIETLKGTVAKNSGYKGTSKLARSVNREIGNALMQVQMETFGANRQMSKPTFVVTDGDVLTVSYKPQGKRKAIQEVYQLISKEDLLNDITGTEKTTTLDLAIYDPHIYYLIYYHYNGDMDTGMREAGILFEKRGRK
jgi:Zinc finger, C3HC4 type (RING finger)